MYLNSTVSYYILPRIPSQLLCLFLALSPLVGKTTSLVKCSTSVSKVPLLLLPQTCSEHTSTAARRAFIYSEALRSQASEVESAVRDTLG